MNELNQSDDDNSFLCKVTCQCAPNIALIKYWGKSNEDLMLPLNSSISITLDNNVLCSTTCLSLLKYSSNSAKPKKIQILFGDSKQEFDEDEPLSKDMSKSGDLISRKRLIKMINKVRSNCELANSRDYFMKIVTSNNFPTACGLASSASGFACLAFCLAKAYDYKGDISELARLGSGSACRSCYGGFVKWTASPLSEKSIASVLYSPDHWPELNILALVLDKEKKAISSTDGMLKSKQTSDLLQHRVRLVEEKYINEIVEAIDAKNFNELAKAIMRDSNSFHACCMDTYPPLFYLNDKSKQIINFVNEFNTFEQTNLDDLKLAYSFDAGPNAFLFVQDTHLNQVLFLIYKSYFLSCSTYDEFIDRYVLFNKQECELLLRKQQNLFVGEMENKINKNDENGFVKYLIHSKIGKQQELIVEKK
jgi:diphosphomevalonate decarboxylase